MRVIQSPGVELREIDLSLNPAIPAGTNLFLCGFSNKGPTDEILQITSVPELEQIYGEPTTPAERYFYFTARQILQDSPGNLFLNRLPYGHDRGSGFGSKFGALVYPAGSIVNTALSSAAAATAAYTAAYTNWTTASGSSALSAAAFSTYDAALSTYAQSLTAGPEYVYTNNLNISAGTYVLGKPKFFELTQQEYLEVLDGSSFNWSTTGVEAVDITGPKDFGKAGLIVLNPAQTTINARGEGYYVALTDNTNAEPTSNHDSLTHAYTVTRTAPSAGISTYTEFPLDRLYFSLTASNDTGVARDNSNISLNIERAYYGFADATTRKFDDLIAMNVYKLRRSPYTPEVTKLEYVTQETYLGSFDMHRKMQDPRGGPPISNYLGGLTVNSQSVRLMINDYINNRTSDTWIDEQTSAPRKKVRLISQSTINGVKQAETTHSYAQTAYDAAYTYLNTTGGTSALSAAAQANLTKAQTALSVADFNLSSSYNSFGGDLAAFQAAAAKLLYSDALFPMGPYVNMTFKTKIIGSLPLKIDRALYKIENDEIFPLDIVVEGGLGTIYTTCCAHGVEYYDDTMQSEDLLVGLSALCTSNDYKEPSDHNDLRGNYHNIFSRFDTFCSQQRKDCLFIADPLRHVFVRGENTKVLSDPDKSFSQYIYSGLRHNFELANSSYACAYANWVKVNDPFAGINCWVPFSGFAAADMASTDANFQPWYAPAGFTRGKVRNVLSMAITPKQKERDQLYKIGMNPVAFFPMDGFTIFGQKTLLRQPSAFDRINVRRLFLFLEKATKMTVKYFVFEPNTMFTRSRVINTIQPIFELAKNSEGLYDYMIVCDKRNNTPDVIDRNEMIIDIYLKPVRAAEFILVNFIATRTSANFNELIAGPRL